MADKKKAPNKAEAKPAAAKAVAAKAVVAKPAAAKKTPVKVASTPNPTSKPPSPTPYQQLMQLRKEMSAQREEIAAATRGLNRVRSINRLAGQVAAEDQALARLADARVAYGETYAQFYAVKGKV